jgi:hypothetical protein
MAIFGAQGIRDAMYNSYKKHIRVFENQPLPEGTTLHQVGLYSALSTRYMAGFEEKTEVELWSELAPFLELEPNDGLAALAEYIVYKEMPVKADVSMLTKFIKKGLSLLIKEEHRSLVDVARLNNCMWTTLVQEE